MQHMLSHTETPADFAQRNDPAQAGAYWAAWNACIGAMGQAVIVNGAGLQAPETATTVRMRDGKRQVQDRPFADPHEHLGGYFIIEVPGRDRALEWAARAPSSGGGTEVRPVLPPPAR